jgi:hypothetical protein
VVAVLKSKRTRSCKKLLMNETLLAYQPGLTLIEDAKLDFDPRRAIGLVNIWEQLVSRVSGSTSSYVLS